jgi:general secretion pathway protein A
MYAHFYQLSESPFNLTPDPKFHYVNESTREALASILHGIKARKGFITLIAEAGTGKTTLLRRIVEELEGETQIVFVFNPGVSFEELLEFICSELGLDTRGCKRLHLLDRLNTHLLSQLTAGRNVVVMIDEAQTLEDSVLEELRLLSNLETSKEKILQIVLSGQPELEEKLRRPSLRQLRQRIGVRTTLKPVQLAEMPAYVETRLRGAGGSRNDLFTPAALKRVWRASQGIPRVINVICDNAMMIAFAEGQRRITPKTLREAMRDLGADLVVADYQVERPWQRSWRLGVYALAAAVLLAFAVAAGRLTWGPIGVAGGYDVASRTTPAAPALAQHTPPRGHAVASAQGAQPETESGFGGGAGAAREPFPEVIPDEVEAHSRAALESDVSQRPLIVDSIRRAEILARSTAARLYDVEAAAASGRRDLAEAALDEVARDQGLTGSLSRPEPVATAEVGSGAGVETGMNPEASGDARADDEVEETLVAPEPQTAPVVERAEPAPVRQAAAAPAPSAKPDTPATKAPAAAATVRAREPAAPPLMPAGVPPLGRLVLVREGDTVWDIAVRQYGEAGPAVLKRILASNPRIQDPLKLEIGSRVFLPFSRPDQMISRDATGYRLLLASGPSRADVAAVADWARTFSSDVRVSTTGAAGGQVHEVHVGGLTSEVTAVSLAVTLLEQATSGKTPQRTAMR